MFKFYLQNKCILSGTILVIRFLTNNEHKDIQDLGLPFLPLIVIVTNTLKVIQQKFKLLK